MLKKFGVLCLILSLALIAAAAGAEAALISGNSYEAAEESGEAPDSPIASISVNYYNNYSVTMSYGAYIDKDALTEGLSGENKKRVEDSVDSALGAIEAEWKERGFEVKRGDDGSVQAVMAQFESITDLYIASGYTGYKKSENPETIWGPLYNVYISKDKTEFSGMEEGSPIADVIGYLFAAEGVTAESVAYVYNYGTRYSTDAVRSDAEKVYRDESLDIIIHSFVMDADNLDREITLYQISPNTLTWYAISIAVALAFAGLGAVIAASKAKKDK